MHSGLNKLQVLPAHFIQYPLWMIWSAGQVVLQVLFYAPLMAEPTGQNGGAGVGSDVYAGYALDANTCWVTTSPATGAYIYKTTDGGASWTQQLFQSGDLQRALVQRCQQRFFHRDL